MRNIKKYKRKGNTKKDSVMKKKKKKKKKKEKKKKKKYNIKKKKKKKKMKTENEIQNILKEIRRNPMLEKLQNKKRWYKVGKYLLQGRKIKLHNETKVSARRTYQYYSKIKGDWDGPSSRKLGK